MAMILVVDDEAQQREQIDRALVQAGHQVELASSGNQALVRLKEKRYDLLVTDLMMGDGTGFEVLEWVRENAPGLPVIVCSAYAKSENLKTYLATNLYRIIRKPFRPDNLAQQAKELLGG
jgi:two-component system response regulator PilR (NtrC family)